LAKGDQFWQAKVVWGDQIWQLKVIWADHFWLPKMVPGPLFDRTTFGVTVPANTSFLPGAVLQTIPKRVRKEGRMEGSNLFLAQLALIHS